MAVNPFLGMRGSGSWADGERPLSWRETVLFLYPNGMAPLTAILSKMGSEKVDDPEFNWFTKTISHQAGTITGLFTNAALNVAYAGAGVVNDVLYVQMAEADVRNFRVGHQALLRFSGDYAVDTNTKVIDRVRNGASSYIAVRLLEADVVTAEGNDCQDTDRALVIGSINAEGAGMPDALSYDPIKLYNYTQIFRTPLELSRTSKLTKYRTGDKYKELKREALEYHSIEMEKNTLWGVRTERVGDNGLPERTTQGIIPTIRSQAPQNISDFRVWSAANAGGAGWIEDDAGEIWLDTMLEQIFRYGATEKLAFCGSGALLGINRLVKARGNFIFTPQTKSYGIQVVEWVTAFGKINLMTHPMFSFEPTNRNCMLILEPKNLKYQFITDTTFFPDSDKQNTGYTRRDGQKEEFLTEAGYEMHHPSTFGYLTGVGLDPSGTTT